MNPIARIGSGDEIGPLFPAFAPKPAAAAPGFAQALDGALGSLLDAQRASETATLELAAGRTEDLHEVMLAVNQAGLAMQLALEVRNRLVDAYHEVMRMTV